MGVSPSATDLMATEKIGATNIATAFDVPPILLGIPGDNTHSNQPDARLAFREETVLPLPGGRVDALNAALAPGFGAVSIRPDLRAIPALVSRRHARAEQLQRSDFLTPNEKRAALGYDPVPGGEQLRVPGAVVPLQSVTSDRSGRWRR